MSWQCIVIEPTDRVHQYLRCYKSDPHPYPDGHLHEAKVQIEDGPVVISDEGYIVNVDEWPRSDPRWPAQCEHCDYRFTDDDRWQLFVDHVYRAADGRECTLRHPFVGAMWRARWMEPHWIGPDGESWMLALPTKREIGDPWCIDGPSSSGGSWTRTGTPPTLTARPSILTPYYHGWLTDGVLSDDLDGRSYPEET